MVQASRLQILGRLLECGGTDAALTLVVSGAHCAAKKNYLPRTEPRRCRRHFVALSPHSIAAHNEFQLDMLSVASHNHQHMASE